ncbi:competence/damage-inducible protein A [bacterium]|nr:competence/damage-inducible protein A [candidate division CSSED10-310 bacterium]
MKIVEIISIGDEILIGDIVNNNAAFMARHLSRIDLDVGWHSVVGDSVDRIVQAMELAWKRADIVLTTGGLGPTHDDVTKDALCRFFRTGYQFHPEIVEEVRARFIARGYEMPDIVRNQGLIPAEADLIRNDLGSAFGIRFDRDGRTLIAMPGVPMEMQDMFVRQVIPALQALSDGSVFLMRRIKTAGIFESQLVTQFRRLNDVRVLADVAVLPKSTGVELRFTVRANNPERAENCMQTILAYVWEDLSQWIVSDDERDLEQVVGDLLVQRNATVATAESCTGGLIAHMLTNVPGSSRYLIGGIVSYENRIKTGWVEVPVELISQYGAVSFPVAEAMAEGIRRVMKTDFGVATTGIAGPDGGTIDKPVGSVHVAVAGPADVVSEYHRFPMDRQGNKQRFATAALDLLRRRLVGR